MAGPSVVVRVLGDVKGLSGSFQQAGKDAENSSSRIHGAFQGVLGLLNQGGVLGPFAQSLSSIDQAFSNLEEHGHRVGQAMLGLGTGLAGVGFGLSVIGSKDQAARQQLQAAIDATGQSWDDYSARVEEAIKHNEKFGDSAAQTENALQILTQATGSPQKALDLLGLATDLAAAKHEDLTSAATQLGKVYNGNTKLLKQFGITVSSSAVATRAADTASKAAATADRLLGSAKQRLADLEALDASRKTLTATQADRLRTAQQKVTSATTVAAGAHQNLTAKQQAAAAAAKSQGGALDTLGAKLKGQASAAADTFAGRLDALKTKIEDQVAAFGNKYGPALQVAGQAMGVLGAIFTTTRGVMEKFAVTETVMTDTQKAAQLAAYEEALALQAEAAAAAEADAASLPLIATVGLIVLAIVALGVIAYVFYRNWSTIWAGIKAAAKAVWDWIKTNWPLLLEILAGPIGLAVAVIRRYWDDIKQGATDVKNWIVDAWNGMVDFFVKMPGRIAHIASGMWNGIANAFIDAINFVIRVWDDLKFTTPHFHIPGTPFDTPSITIRTPHIDSIPHMAQGGLITSTGLIFAHAGEAIIPAPGRTGPAMVFNGDNHFNSEVDVELFMRRAAWVVQTQKI